MSKICENCGNMIPEGTDVCPGCGRQLYNDDALQAVLSELSFALDEIQNEEPAKEPAEDVSGNTIPFRVQKTEEQPQKKTVDPAIAAISAESQKKTAAPERKAAPKKTAASAAAKNASGKKKKKKKKSGGGSTAIAIIVGILIALLLVAGAAVFMLYRMGFFELLSDDQLLQTSTSQVEETLSTVEPSEEPEITSVVEETVEGSIVEEAPVEEAEPEEQVLTPELSIDEPVEEGTEVDKFTLTGADSMTFKSRGETAEIVYVISPEEAKWDIVWESSDETVATVSESGVISARRGGSCTVTGTCGDLEVSVEVICSFTVPTTVLDMNYSDITMDHEGQEVQMKIDYDLTDEQIAATLWESSDPAVATVDDEGLVTAIADGTVVISASIGDYTASCIVRCVNVTGNKGVNPEDSEYVINYEDVTLTRKGEYFQLSLKSILGNELPEFTWKSSDSEIATVDSKGIVTAVADGTCKITTSIGEDDFECIVRVHITG